MSTVRDYFRNPEANLSWFKDAQVYEQPDVSGTLLMSIEQESMHRWSDLETRLFGYKRLTENWDYEGADAPRPEIVDSAIDFLRILKIQNERVPAPSTVTISPAGAVIFVWRDGGLYVDAEISSPRLIEWMTIVNNARPTHAVTRF